MNKDNIKIKITIGVAITILSIIVAMSLLVNYFERKTYIVTLDLRGGRIESESVITTNGTLDTDDMPDVKHPKYKLVGWKLDNNKIDSWPITIHANAILQVVWDVDMHIDQDNVYLTSLVIISDEGYSQYNDIVVGTKLKDIVQQTNLQSLYCMDDNGDFVIVDGEYVVLSETVLYTSLVIEQTVGKIGV
ncbi:MAG: hypothetical protein LBK70_01175 [Clostridiales bacterium]|jgi:hypothetical protein|nr:hypothetical protein [Clostridiales bacterium]